MKEIRKSRLLLRGVSSIAIKITFSIRKTLIFENKIRLSKPCIIAMFHDEMIPFIEYFKSSGVVILASENDAGASIAAFLRTLGYETVLGSAARSGQRAIRQLLMCIKEGKKVMITVDGSRGPRHKIKPGVIFLAKKSQAPLYLFRACYKGIRIRCSWDKFLYPLPFSRVAFKYNQMIVDSDANSEEIRKQIIEAESQLKNLANHSSIQQDGF